LTDGGGIIRYVEGFVIGGRGNEENCDCEFFLILFFEDGKERQSLSSLESSNGLDT
jgi:hypothetical protein